MPTEPILPSQITLPLIVELIREEGYHIFINITANGKPVRMLLDTGASRTVFDSTSLRQIAADLEMEANEDLATGLGSSTVENFIAEIDEILLGDLKLQNYQIGVLDLQHVNTSYEGIGLLPIAGVIGSDLLVKFKAIIDIGKKEICLCSE